MRLSKAKGIKTKEGKSAFMVAKQIKIAIAEKWLKMHFLKMR